ncbi:MAG: histidine kinase [Chitinophagaceae bacterium]|nr:histidine kinase [Chitinophagaceae bacterium]
MIWPFRYKAETRYWLKAFAFYALAEAVIQLVFIIILNYFGKQRISIPEFHLVMWAFQCLLIWPIWWVAWSVRRQHLAVQVLVNVLFYGIYSWIWFGPVQEAIDAIYNSIQQVTRVSSDRQVARLDSGNEYSYLNYQLLKHSFRLSWFYLAAYFYNYLREEKQRLELAVANKELQLRMLKWHLNPAFYFKTISSLQQLASQAPQKASAPILQLARVMEYVIYEARQPLVDMKKEMEFLDSYVQLINEQPGRAQRIRLHTRSGDVSLRIAPLLLAGIVDNIISAAGNAACTIEVQTQGKTLLLRSLELNRPPGEPALLEELYKERYKIDYSSVEGYKLSLQLDESD